MHMTLVGTITAGCYYVGPTNSLENHAIPSWLGWRRGYCGIFPDEVSLSWIQHKPEVQRSKNKQIPAHHWADFQVPRSTCWSVKTQRTKNMAQITVGSIQASTMPTWIFWGKETFPNSVSSWPSIHHQVLCTCLVSPYRGLGSRRHSINKLIWGWSQCWETSHECFMCSSEWRNTK